LRMAKLTVTNRVEHVGARGVGCHTGVGLDGVREGCCLKRNMYS
jgi:hypothetical protein